MLRPTALVLVVTTALVAGGCNSDSDDDGRAAAASSTSEPVEDHDDEGPDGPGITTGPCDPPVQGRPPEGVTIGSETALDADGDGEDDAAGTYLGPDGWNLWIDADGGGLTTIPLEDRTAEPRVLGGHDVDGDGREELFVQMGSGASAAVVGLARIVDCKPTVVRRSVDAAPAGLALFPVGTSAANQSGLGCEGTFLDARSATTTDGRSYTWTEERHRLEGASVVRVDTRTGTATSPDDDDLIVGFGTLRCGDVSL